MTSKSSAQFSDETAHLRSVVLDSAREMVEATGGLRVNLDGLSLDLVIKEAGVPRTSAYRIWPNRKAFHEDLMRELAAPDWGDPQGVGDRTIQLARLMFAEHLDVLDTLEGRQALLAKLCQGIAAESYRQLSESPLWRTSISLAVASASMQEAQARDGIVAEMASAEIAWLSQVAMMYEDAATLLGMTLRPGLTYLDLALVIAATLDGLFFHAQSTPAEVATLYTVTMQGESSPGWHLSGLSALFLFESMATFDDEYDREVALAAYLKRLAAR